MPLDVTNYKPTIKPLETGLAGLKQLGDALRFIPQEFQWDFTVVGDDCRSNGCAIGLAHMLWCEQIPIATSYAVARVLKIPRDDLAPIFGQTEKTPYGCKKPTDVTPNDVADAIDRYIERREAEGRAA